jgi:hypothetical protein
MPATVVLVFGNGTVENEVIEIDEDTSDAALAAATVHLASALTGSTLVSTRDPRQRRRCGRRPVRTRRSTRCRQASTDDHVYVGGASTVAEAFDAVEIVRQVLHTLEQQFVVVSLVRDIVDRGMSVAIGVEHGVEPLSACSVVVAPVVVDGEHVGSVGRARPDPHELPAGDGDGRHRERSPRTTIGRGLMAADYYELLGVSRQATADEIKKAYRKRARELHPDANRDDPDAAERFKELSKAYTVLSDDQQRARYDQFGEAGVGGAGGGGGNFEDLFGGGGLGDIFDAFFGGGGGGGGPFGGRRGPSGPPSRSGSRGGGRDHVRAGGVRRPDPRRAEAARAVRRL